MDFVVQKCNEGWFVIDFVISIFCLEMSDINFIKVISNNNQKTHADDIKHTEFQTVIG